MSDFVDAIGSGSTREALEAMRDKLAREMEFADAAILAQISGQLVKVLAALDSLPPEQKSRVDDLTAQRKKRVAQARANASTKRQKKQRGS